MAPGTAVRLPGRLMATLMAIGHCPGQAFIILAVTVLTIAYNLVIAVGAGLFLACARFAYTASLETDVRVRQGASKSAPKRYQVRWRVRDEPKEPQRAPPPTPRVVPMWSHLPLRSHRPLWLTSVSLCGSSLIAF